LELLKKSSPLSNQEVPDKKTLNSFNDLFYLTADGKSTSDHKLALRRKCSGSSTLRKTKTGVDAGVSGFLHPKRK
jgi:hypothetical protein